MNTHIQNITFNVVYTEGQDEEEGIGDVPLSRRDWRRKELPVDI